MMLQLEQISKSFDGRKVLDGVSLSLAQGEVVGLQGRNGAGKTTLLRIVCKLLEPDSGQVWFDGHPMTFADLRLVGYLPEERGLYRNMGVEEQAVYLTTLKGLSHQQATAEVRQWFARLGMEEWSHRRASTLSKGMQQRLQLVVAVAHKPRLLLLDEPFSGFDEANTDMLRREISRLAHEGTSVLLSTHNRVAAQEMCSKILQL